MVNFTHGNQTELMAQTLRIVPFALAIFTLERLVTRAGIFSAQSKAADRSFLIAGVCIHFSLSGITVAVRITQKPTSGISTKT